MLPTRCTAAFPASCSIYLRQTTQSDGVEGEVSTRAQPLAMRRMLACPCDNVPVEPSEWTGSKLFRWWPLTADPSVARIMQVCPPEDPCARLRESSCGRSPVLGQF